MEPIISFLKNVKLARKQVFRNLTVFPLLSPDGNKPDYLTLEQALDENAIRITETEMEGHVPELKLINSGESRVLIVEGEELVGAKQNRIVNATFLVSGKTEVVIPMSCVEQGRWSYDSHEFSSGKTMMHASLRREHQQDIAFSIRQGEGYRSNQGKIWNDISGKMQRMKVNAPTAAMSDVYATYEENLSKFLEKFTLIEWQTGAVFAINGQVLGLECFAYNDTFSRFFDKLVKSYALDALDNLEAARTDPVAPDKARRFVVSTVKSRGQRHSSLGLGENVTFESRMVSGAALVERDCVLHLSAFRKRKKNGSRPVKYQRFSQRRRRH